MADSILTRARYAGLDFDTHADDLRAQLQIKFSDSFNDFVVSSTGIMLLDLTAFGLSTLSFYLDRRATDTYLDTARTRKSVSRLTRQVGYKMGGAVSSGVDLDVSVTTPIAVNVTLQEGFQFLGPNSLIFEVARAVTFTPAEQTAGTVKSVRCYEGETVTEQFVSTGEPNQVFELAKVPDGKGVVDGGVVVTVDGSPFEEVELLEYGSTDQFEIGYSDDPPTLRFGDGISGNIPITTATIDVTYVAASGRDGQVAKDTIQRVRSPLVVAFNTIGLSITNPLAAVGGDFAESLAKAKANAPKVYLSRQRGITAGDYGGLAGAYADPLFGRVAVARAISARSAANDLTLKNFLLDIDVAIAAFHPTIDAQVVIGTAALSALTVTDLGNISTGVADANTALADIVTTNGLVTNNARIAKQNAADIGVTTAGIASLVTAGKAAVDALGPSGTGDLTTPQADSLKGYFDAIQARSNEVSVSALNVTSVSDAILTESTTIGYDAGLAQAATADITTAVSSAGTNGTTVSGALTAISVANTSVEADILAATSGIFTHVDMFLSEDCKANLVVVPILVLDAAGFYSAPSAGLVDSLQAFLDARKDVTHTVSVTSGAAFLVSAVITIRVGVRRNLVSEQVVKTSVEAAVDGILRNRSFGACLYESDVEQVVLAVTGVAFANVSITGPAGRLDSDGNLVPLDSEVITKGSVTVTTEFPSC